MKTTPFTPKHEELGARMAEFAGYYMPIEYTGVNDEHIAVRENAGVFDVSHMGEFWVKGPKAYELVQRITSNDISRLSEGKAQYNCLPNGKGGIVDDLLVYYYEKDKYLLVVNAANIEKDWAWVNEQNTQGADLENASDKIAQLAVQGPNATKILQKLTDVQLSDIPFYQFTVDRFAGIGEVIISATGYTGAGGFELYCHNGDGPQLWDAIFEAGKQEGIKAVGLAARDTLRLEMGYCLYGNDIDDTTSPLEAGLGWITKLVEGNDFIDREKIEKQKEEGTTRRLSAFVMEERGIPRKGYDILNVDGKKVGTVTSGTMSPMMKQGIGMGYIDKPFNKSGTEIKIKIRKKELRAKTVKLPIYKG